MCVGGGGGRGCMWMRVICISICFGVHVGMCLSECACV